jgi:hypothetical protein
MEKRRILARRTRDAPWCGFSVLVRTRLLFVRERNVSAVGPSSQTCGGRPVPLYEEPNVRRGGHFGSRLVPATYVTRSYVLRIDLGRRLPHSGIDP